MKGTKYVISSTHIDSQGYKMAMSALESMLPQLNGVRKPRLGLEHIRTFPPLGVIMNGNITQGEDSHFYLTAEMVYFDKQELIMQEDGSQLLREYFSEGFYPFIECEEDENDTLTVATDPANYDSHEVIEKIHAAASEESSLEFRSELIGRKSILPDPETIITITKSIAVTLGIIKSKIPEKVGEAIGEDLAKFYKLISKLVVETIKNANPSNRPQNFIISYPNDICNIELVITTHNVDKVLNALTKEKLKIISDKLDQLQNLHPEKIQFLYNTGDLWEFNYLLSKDGSVIGTIKSFNKRNKLYNKILEQQNQQSKSEE